MHLPSRVILEEFPRAAEAHGRLDVLGGLQHGLEALPRLLDPHPRLLLLILFPLLQVLVEAGLLLSKRLQSAVPA